MITGVLPDILRVRIPHGVPLWQEARNPSGCGFFLYSCGFPGIFACA
nr:MAG TPA: hypothetical protein [Caudoviricetes sp.]